MNKKQSVLVWSMIVFLIVAISMSASATSEKVNSKNVRAYVTHQIIEINSNSELQNMAISEHWNGNGTENNPYIIENYEIDSHGGGRGIYLGNTTLYVNIINVNVFNATSNSGIYYHGGGVQLYNTQNVYVHNSNLTNNNYGMYIQGGSQNGIMFSIIDDNAYYGIYAYNTHNIYIRGNNVSYNKGGISMYSSFTCGIYHNDIYQNGINKGISLVGANKHHTMQDNKIMFTHDYGIYISGINTGDIEDNEISDNEIFNNTDGIWISTANNTNINNNNIHNNSQNGIYTYSTVTNTSIEHNTFAGNAEDGLYISLLYKRG